MTSDKTAEAILDQIQNWCDDDRHSMQDVLTLLTRIAAVKGNKSFTDTIDLLRSKLKDRIDDL